MIEDDLVHRVAPAGSGVVLARPGAADWQALMSEAVEPPAADNPLFGLSNVVLTAHLAGPTQESNIARLRNAFDNVQSVARGELPLWIAPELAAES